MHDDATPESLPPPAPPPASPSAAADILRRLQGEDGTALFTDQTANDTRNHWQRERDNNRW